MASCRIMNSETRESEPLLLRVYRVNLHDVGPEHSSTSLMPGSIFRFVTVIITYNNTANYLASFKCNTFHRKVKKY